MKNRILSSLLIFIAIFSLNSCGVDEPVDGFVPDTDSNTGTPGSNTGSFKVDFKGATWTATKIQAAIFDNTITILAEKPNGESFVIGIVDTEIAGTYPANINEMGYLPAGSLEGYWSSNPVDPAENTGSVTVSNVNTTNNTISGTFNFKGYWDDDSKTPIVFTNGVFKDITFTRENPTGSGSDTFYAKIDGAEFVENRIDVARVVSGGDYYSIIASKTNDDSISLRISESLSVGTYQITGAFGRQVNGTCYLGDDIYTGNSGSVTIISKSATHISGTFNFVAESFTSGGTKTVSTGAFSLDLP